MQDYRNCLHRFVRESQNSIDYEKLEYNIIQATVSRLFAQRAEIGSSKLNDISKTKSTLSRAFRFGDCAQF
jgi:hypothetical protein